MALETYRQKRNFRISPEPEGGPGRRKTRGLAFVIQKHAASHLHYDFRLELDGVLLSWAVPKGPSLDPDDKRLAMHVEDHPMEYGDFEGVIPPRQYGAGTVLLWDRGVWVPREDPLAGYRKGRLKFDLEGEKLRGGWTLVRTRSSKYGGDKAWLLIKEDDAYARRGPDAVIVEDQPRSVASGRVIEEIAAERDRVWQSGKSVAENVKRGALKGRKRNFPVAKTARAVRSPMPVSLKPQLATLVEQAPAGDEWLAEMKYDGYRMLCRIDKGAAQMFSRTGKEWSANFATICRAAERLGLDEAWLDGEIVVLQADGRSSFQALQNALSLEDQSALCYFVFDLPYLNGFDLRKAALLDRKRLLELVLESPPALLRFGSHVHGHGPEFFAQACTLGLEGIVAKRADSVYFPGRNRNWVKVKCGMRQEMVIGGFTDPEGSRSGLGALLLGVYEPDGSLRYSGKVGTGFDTKTLASLRARLDKMVRKTPAFTNPPRGAEARRAHWVQPTLVAEVAFTEWTDEATLRHPSFQGLREDKTATDVVREHAVGSPAGNPAVAKPSKLVSEAAPLRKGGAGAPAAKRKTTDADSIAGVQISNPGKLLYHDAGLTKRDLANYYASVGDWIVPHLQGRPLSLLRCPDGWQKECFYQKKADRSANPAIDRVSVRTSQGPAVYMMANSVSAVVALLQMGALELHPWGARDGRLEFPDRVIFDIDPDEGLAWSAVVEAARMIRTLLEQIGLQGYLKTTGGKGLHIVVPIEPALRWDAIKGFSKAVAELLTRTFPDRFTDKVSKAARRGRIFIDYLRNDEGSTAVAAYSTRARANAPVSTPVAWEEAVRDIRMDRFNVKNLPARLKRMKKDPWAGFFELRQSIDARMLRSVGYDPTK